MNQERNIKSYESKEKNGKNENTNFSHFAFKLTVLTPSATDQKAEPEEFLVYQRYFDIDPNNPEHFNRRMLYLRDNGDFKTRIDNAIDYCVYAIDDDLKSKSRVYMHYTTPQIFENEAEMHAFLNCPKGQLMVKNEDGTYSYQDGVDEHTPTQSMLAQGNKSIMRLGEPIYLKRKGSQEYTWNGENAVEVRDGEAWNKGEFTDEIDTAALPIFKFAFCFNGKVIAARIWEGRYPRVVRNKIDLSNMAWKKVINEQNPIEKASFEETMQKRMSSDKSNLVDYIVSIFRDTLSAKESKDMSDTVTYGDTTYKLNWTTEVADYYFKIAKKYKSRTIKYFAEQ